MLSAYAQASHWAPAQPLHLCVYSVVSSVCFSTVCLSPHLLYFLSRFLLTSLSPPRHWQLSWWVREPTVWTRQRVYCPSWQSDANKHLSHTDHLTLSSLGLSGSLWYLIGRSWRFNLKCNNLSYTVEMKFHVPIMIYMESKFHYLSDISCGYIWLTVIFMMLRSQYFLYFSTLFYKIDKSARPKC